MSTLHAPAPETGSRSLVLAGEVFHVQRPKSRKASVALAIVRALSRSMPELQRRIAAFTRDYERDNVLELDRVQARIRHPPIPLTGRDGEPLLDGNGRPVLLDSEVDRLTEADWESAGGVYRVPRSPSGAELVFALFDYALEVAEENVYRLLALFTLSNDEVTRARNEGAEVLDHLLDERAAWLLDNTYPEELLELAVVVTEVASTDFRRKVDELGARAGNLRRLVGMKGKATTSPATEPPAPTSTDGPSSSRPSSSTSSEDGTGGAPTPSSTSPSTSSSSSDGSPNGTPNGRPPSAPSPSSTAAPGGAPE